MLRAAVPRCRHLRDCIETIPKSPRASIMGGPDGGRNASFIPFMLPHYWGLGGAVRLFTVSKSFCSRSTISASRCVLVLISRAVSSSDGENCTAASYIFCLLHLWKIIGKPQGLDLSVVECQEHKRSAAGNALHLPHCLTAVSEMVKRERTDADLHGVVSQWKALCDSLVPANTGMIDRLTARDRRRLNRFDSETALGKGAGVVSCSNVGDHTVRRQSEKRHKDICNAGVGLPGTDAGKTNRVVSRRSSG